MCWLGSTGDRFPKTFTCGSQNITAHWQIYRRALAGSTPAPLLPFSEQQILFFQNIITIFHKYKAITPPDLHYPPN